MTILYATTMFLSGALLFLVQPLFAKMVLPLYGGAPAVWNTAMLFYQVTLLAGYLYAHAVRRWLTPRQQLMVHLVVLLLPALVLPMQVPDALLPTGGDDPVPRLLLLLAVGVGLPFFVVSTTSPLLQAWFGAGAHGASRDPYALYAASNAGSMLSLLAYPLLIEPAVALQTQSAAWSLAYALFVVAMGACAVAFARRSTDEVDAHQQPAASSVAAPVLPWRRRLRWVALAFVPSSLMLSVTTFMSTNIAPVPLLWILPLALYLLTFILAFASRRLVSLPGLRRAFPLVLLPLVVVTLSEAAAPIGLFIAIHLVGFTLIALACHSELAVDAPAPVSLTEFYLWVSIGGALGGVFNALLAPRLFDSVLEYPLVLTGVALLMRAPVRGVGVSSSGAAPGLRQRTLDIVLPIVLASTVLLVDSAVRILADGSSSLAKSAALGVAALLSFSFSERRLRFGLGIAAMVVGSLALEGDRRLLHAERSFFGISRIFLTGGGRMHELAHGNISHGAQNRTTDLLRREPLTYYTRSGPAGQVLHARQREGRARSVAVVGLGAGSLACYSRPGDRWTFYEIDPVVVRLARDARFFSYLEDCAPDASVVVGDARLSLRSAADRSFDVILLDAYSADAIPVHLMTREAVALYRRKLSAAGVIALHVSNRYFELEPVVTALARDAGLRVLVRRDIGLSAADVRMGKTESIWMLLTENSTDLGAIGTDAAWRSPATAARTSVWTDDFSSAISALR